MIKLSNPEAYPEHDEQPGLRNAPADIRNRMRGEVEALGLNFEDTTSVRDSIDGPDETVADVAPPPSESVAEPDLAAFKEQLSNIADLATELTSINMEHRVADIRDMLPIWGNIRSHSRATREGDLITDMKQELDRLKEIATRDGLNLNLKQLEDAVGAMKVPAGFSKWFASVTLLRGLHRSFFAPRAERIRRAVTELRREIRR